jgi:hypothetical protein
VLGEIGGHGVRGSGYRVQRSTISDHPVALFGKWWVLRGYLVEAGVVLDETIWRFPHLNE